MKPQAAMVFAAGFGTRLGDLVKEKPKPLVEVAGKPLIDHALEVVREARVQRCTVNLHYKAELLAEHLANHSNLTLIHEYPRILDTGGGLLNAIDTLGNGPVFTLNSDTIWRGTNPFLQLADSWHPKKMGALLMLASVDSAFGHTGGGDFVFTQDNELRRSQPTDFGYVYTGAQIIDTRWLAAVGKEKFSVNEVWDRMIRDGKLAGIVYSGTIGDAGSPTGIQACEELLSR